MSASKRDALSNRHDPLDSGISAKAIFLEALEIPSADDRDQFIQGRCGGDESLGKEVWRLLAHHGEMGSFLQSPPQEAMLDPTVALSISERPGTQIGRYKLLQQIGEGGMGTVFMAEQTKPIARRVALKIIKPGMDSKAVVARFEAERQALAMMDHPSIAKVLDAGTTESGRPYFVMELVKGIPITEYCDAHKLPLRQRLDLFIQVCQAVQHAHQKGIIHRDIKPSNVLVAKYDNQPVPKIIDFGVAKAISQRLTEKTMFTQFGQIVGTLEYMSPEQAQFNQLDVDTRSDIYSLGVLLYELLTGETPFDGKRLRSSAFEEVLRILREEEPPRPSNRISTLGDKAATVSGNRACEAGELGTSLRGDLDWIVMKSMDKDRGRRYETAIAFAADLQRYLDDEPVVARPPSTGYRLRKFVKRNRSLAVSGSIAICALLIGFVAAIGFGLFAMQTATELDRTLRNYHRLLIESVLADAASGDIEKVNATIASADDERFPVDWKLTLEGLAHLHQGDNDQTIEKLEEALRINPENVSAKAMLTLAYFHTGDWNEWVKLAAEVEEVSPRNEFREFDELFLAYAWFYTNPDKAESQLNATVEKHRTWVIPSVLLANLEGHQAMFYEGESPERKRKRMKDALQRIQNIPPELVDDNPFLLVGSLFPYAAASQILDDSSGSLAAEANRLAARLDEYPRYAVGGLTRGSFYFRAGNSAKARQAWDDILQYGRGMILHWPASALFLEGEGDEVVARGRDWSDPEARIALAYILALSDNPNDQAESLEVFQELAPEADTWLRRHYLIQVPLLLQKPEIAKTQCEAWLQNQEVPELSLPLGGWEKESIRFIADPTNPSFAPRIDESSNDTDKRLFYENYQMALVDFANGRLTGAVTRLEQCSSYDVPQLRWWVAGFKKNFESRIGNSSKFSVIMPSPETK